MITVYSPEHRLRNARTELHRGELVKPFECPERAEFVIDRVRSEHLGPVLPPLAFGRAPLLAVHDADYVAFLASAWSDWLATGASCEAIPDCWPARRMTQRVPQAIAGKLGYYAMACETSISAGTFEAASISADVALTGAKQLHGGARGAFALCRPPGHHAGRDLYGGYCFLNNAAIAAQYLRDHGAARVAILDVDFHHGNGTQDIFYDRADVLFVSLHGDPATAFPYFSGYADETGSGPGLGCNFNLPLPAGMPFDRWRDALLVAIAKIREFGAEALVVSLGVDTFVGDPISTFKLASPDFVTYGALIGTLGVPTLFVMEGGYAVAEIGINVVNVLCGFEGTS